MKNGFGRELTALKSALKASHPKADIRLIDEAAALSRKWHEGQFRESGEPYFIHPLAVAKMLADRGLDEVIVSAALLHDIIEDTKISRAELREKFGPEIYGLVEGLTNLDREAFRSRKEQSTANIIKTIMASSKDLRVLIIKLFDKLHNLRTLRHLPREKQMRIAADALVVYVPLTHKLGMHGLKYEMEDLCFSSLEPKKFKKLKKEIEKNRKRKEADLKKAIQILKKKHPEMDWEFSSKRKSFYSVHSKMLVNSKELSELNDTLILKVIVPQEQDCYSALGKIHSAFKPLPKKMKDLIAIPEYAIYQSLHTQVIGPSKKPLKVYIFSREMDEIGREGVVALLRKKAKNPQLKRFEKMFSKLSRPEVTDSEELAGTLNLDFHNRTMIVFTDKGEVIELPPESTAIDFAFFKDGKKAERAFKAEINGKILPLWTKINSGDRVKIIYSDHKQVNTSWLSLAYSEKARRNVEKSLKEYGKHNGNLGLVKFRIDSMDRSGLLYEQCRIMHRNGFNLETAICKINSDASTGYTEFIVKNSRNANIQRAAKQLRELKETLGLNIDYLK